MLLLLFTTVTLRPFHKPLGPQVRNTTFRRMEKGNAFNNLLGMVLDDGQRECRCLVCNRAFANDEELGEPAVLPAHAKLAACLLPCCLLMNLVLLLHAHWEKSIHVMYLQWLQDAVHLYYVVPQVAMSCTFQQPPAVPDFVHQCWRKRTRLAIAHFRLVTCCDLDTPSAYSRDGQLC